jgi:hypothetical protein
MRRMATVGQSQVFCAGGVGQDRVDLRHRAVGVVHALNGEHGAGDAFCVFSHVEVAERLTQPHVAPLPKRAFQIGVKASEFFRQVGGFKSLFHVGDGGDANRLHEKVRSHCHTACALKLAGVEQGDGAAVGVAHEQRLFDAELFEQGGQGGVGLTAHVIRFVATRAAHVFNRAGLAVASA